MLKIEKKLYYYGEFGYFNFVVLGYLEEFLHNNKIKINIQTYDDYFKILNLKFPNRFRQTESIVVPDRDSKRIYHRIQDDKFNKDLINQGYHPLDSVLKCEINDWKTARTKIKQIIYPLQLVESSCKYISIVCRKRMVDIDRNLSYDNWMKIIDNINTVYPNLQIIFHGLSEETLKIENSLFCCDILESIKYLNQSLFFVSSMSGFAQFASNCNCSILQIGPEFQMIPYNPFDKINLQIDRSNLKNFKDYIKQFAL